MSVGIKETREVIQAGRSYAQAVVKVAEDGKINLLDARHMLAPVRATMDAVRGSEHVVEELKDVDGAELDQLMADFSGLAADAHAAAEALKKLKPQA